MKWAQVPDPDKVGLSKDALFLESEPGDEAEDWVATVESEALLAGLAELEGAIQVQTITLQGQLVTLVSHIITASILHFKVHTTDCIRLLMATSP